MARTLPGDWYPGTIPENVELDETAYVDTTHVFSQYRSEAPVGAKVGRAVTLCLGTVLDVGPRGRVSFGEYAIVNAAHIICDVEVEIGDYSLISWGAVLMDSYRLPLDIVVRRSELELVPLRDPRCMQGASTPRAVRVGRNAWIGFEACVLPGVTVGEGSIVGAGSVVAADVPPCTLVVGNPAHVVRQLDTARLPHDDP